MNNKMINLKKNKYDNYLIKIFFSLGILFSFFIFIGVRKIDNTLDFYIYNKFNLSFVDIALNNSLETNYYTNFLGNLLYLLSLIHI
jgi:hypothetical protein